MSREQGFTLIEVMIVVAILAVLVGIASVAYQDYTVRSQVTAGLADISGGKSLFETQVIANNSTSFDVGDIGLRSPTPRCSELTMSPAAAGGFIQCKMLGHPLVRNQTVRLERNSSGEWRCVTSVASARHRPEGCL